MRRTRFLLCAGVLAVAILASALGGTAMATVNPSLFSAVAGGTADATPVFAAAEATAGANATIVVPPGTYKVTGLRLRVPGQVWQLQSGVRLVLAGATNAPVIIIEAPNVTVAGPGSIDGNAHQNAGPANVGVFINTGGTGSSLRGLSVQNAYQGGVLDYASNVTIQGNKIINVTGTGIYSQPGAAGDLTNLHITNNVVDKSMQPAAKAWGYGIQVHGMPSIAAKQRNLVIAANTVRLPIRATATMLGIEAWGGCPQAAISQNAVTGGTMGISADRCPGVAIAHNQVASAVQNGIEVASDDHAAVTYNTVTGNLITGAGINFDGASGSSYGTVANNTVTGAIGMSMYIIGGAHDLITKNLLVSGQGHNCYPVYAQNAPGTVVSGNQLQASAQTLALVVFDGRTSSGSISGNVGSIANLRVVILWAGATATVATNKVAR
jgi:hypothetical protein